jgi:hypothetical protein
LWWPGAAAAGLYFLLEVLDRLTDAGSSTVAGWFGQLVSFLLSVFLFWLAASVLVFARRWPEARAHLSSRLNRHFLALVCVCTGLPLARIVIWVLPPMLLMAHYSVFIAPTVGQLKAYVPPPLTAFHQFFMVFEEVLADWDPWWLALVPSTVVVTHLYVGRCLVLFDRQSR